MTSIELLRENLKVAITAKELADRESNTDTRVARASAFLELKRSIEESVPIVMITSEHKRLQVGTVGLLVDRYIMLYSEAINSPYTLSGCDLTHIIDFTN